MFTDRAVTVRGWWILPRSYDQALQTDLAVASDSEQVRWKACTPGKACQFSSSHFLPSLAVKSVLSWYLLDGQIASAPMDVPQCFVHEYWASCFWNLEQLGNVSFSLTFVTFFRNWLTQIGMQGFWLPRHSLLLSCSNLAGLVLGFVFGLQEHVQMCLNTFWTQTLHLVQIQVWFWENRKRSRSCSR